MASASPDYSVPRGLSAGNHGVWSDRPGLMPGDRYCHASQGCVLSHEAPRRVRVGLGNSRRGQVCVWMGRHVELMLLGLGSVQFKSCPTRD